MVACSRCGTQLPKQSNICTGCGLTTGTPAPELGAPVAPIPAVVPPVPVPAAPTTPVENPWRKPRADLEAEGRVPVRTSAPPPAAIPPDPFGKRSAGSVVGSAMSAPSLPVESKAIPVAFALWAPEAEHPKPEPEAATEKVVPLRPMEIPKVAPPVDVPQNRTWLEQASL
jgi:hypothetical protein